MPDLDQLPEAENLSPEDNQLNSRIIAVPDPSDEIVAEITRRFALGPIKPADIFTYQGTISTDVSDSYYTEMDPDTSLANFARDFSEGQSLLNSHNSWALESVIGQSYRGVLEDISVAEGKPATKRVLVDWYMTRDDANAVIIQRVVAGTVRRQSVGFGGDDMEIISKQDGKSIWESDYYPGMKLPGDLGRATFIVKNAHAMEGSLVFKNSTPGSLVERGAAPGAARIGLIVARVADLARRGDIPREEVARLGQRWGVRFAAAPKQFAQPGIASALRTHASGQRWELEGGTMAKGSTALADLVYARAGKKLSRETVTKLEGVATRIGDARDELVDLVASVSEDVENEANEDRTTELAEQRAGVVAALADLGLTVDRAAEDLPAAIRAQQAEIATLRAGAADGQVYREAMITEALAEGARALGDKFDRTAREAQLRALPLGEVIERRDSWKEIGDKRFPGGRGSTEGATEQIAAGARQPAAAPIPISAYRVG